MGSGNGKLFIGTKGGCFTAGTLILTEYGLKPIEEIQIGDYVYSKNIETEEIQFKRVIETFIHTAKETMCIHFGQTKIETTLEHPFWIYEQDWNEAQHIKQGDLLTSKENISVIVEKTEKILYSEQIEVYNFHVEDFHTYYVSEFNILVHNDSKKTKVEIPKSVERQAKKFSPEAKKGYEKAIEGLKSGDTRGLNDHALTGNRSGQFAVDIKGLGKGRGGGRIIYEKIDGTIRILEILKQHEY